MSATVTATSELKTPAAQQLLEEFIKDGQIHLHTPTGQAMMEYIALWNYVLAHIDKRVTPDNVDRIVKTVIDSANQSRLQSQLLYSNRPIDDTDTDDD